MKNINTIVSKVNQDGGLHWKNNASCAVIYISEGAQIEEVLPLVQKDFEMMAESTVIVRVPMLPIGSLIEIELVIGVESH